jgi:hypothetical protein
MAPHPPALERLDDVTRHQLLAGAALAGGTTRMGARATGILCVDEEGRDDEAAPSSSNRMTNVARGHPYPRDVRRVDGSRNLENLFMVITRIPLLMTLLSLPLAGCGDDTGGTGDSSESAQASGGGTGSHSGQGGGGTTSGGFGGSTSSGDDCGTCAELFRYDFELGPEEAVCSQASIDLSEAVRSCVCQACESCTGLQPCIFDGGALSNDCKSCAEQEIAGECQAEYGACEADTGS